MHHAFDHVKCSRTLECCNDATFEWEYASPAVLLQYTLKESPALQQVYESVLARDPCTETAPWSIVLGFDEFTPGAQFSLDNRRKGMNLYYNFVNLGPHVLSLDGTWFVLCCVRHDEMVNVKGGWSFMFATLLREMFLDPNNGFLVAGVGVVLRGKHHILFARLRNILSDGDGHRMLFCWKGAAGLKCCLRHSNVLKKGSHALISRCTDHVEISCASPEKFRVRSHADFCRSYDLVKAATLRRQANGMTQTLFEQVTMAEGFTYTPGGMPYDDQCRGLGIFESITLDWVHSACQDGMLTTDMTAYMSAASEKLGISFAQVEHHLKGDWHFPMAMRSKSGQLHRIFSQYRKSSDSDEVDRVRASASELIGVYVLVRDFIETEVGDPPELARERQSFEAACLCIDIILRAKMSLLSMRDASNLLTRALSDHMQKHLAAYGDRYLKPKNHWMFDVAERFATDPCVLDALIVERLHLVVRRAAELIRNLRSYEASVLSVAIDSQIAKLSNLSGACSLTTKSNRGLFGFSDADFADNMQVLGMHISVDDIVFRGSDAAKVCACALEDGVAFAIVDEMDVVATLSRHKSTYRPAGRLQVWRALDMEQALIKELQTHGECR